jgi:biopolymer transport protein ExbD
MAAVAAQRFRARYAPAADPNVIPFIDVLLVLLIIFMVTAPKPTTDLRVDLPRPVPPIATLVPPTMVAVQQGPEGLIYTVGGERVARGELAQRALAHMLAADPALTPEYALAEGRIFVRADLDVAYQGVVSTVDDLQQADFRRVAIVAQDADAPE